MRQPLQPANGASSATDTVERVQILDASGVVVSGTTGTPADAFAAPGAIPEEMSFQMLWNGTTWDRRRANIEGTLLASAARTTSTASANQTNHNARGVLLSLEASVAGTGNLTIFVQSIDPITATATSIGGAGSTTLTTTGVRQMVLYPGATVAGNLNYPLPRTWRGLVLHSDASSWTYTLSYALIL